MSRRYGVLRLSAQQLAYLLRLKPGLEIEGATWAPGADHMRVLDLVLSADDAAPSPLQVTPPACPIMRYPYEDLAEGLPYP